VVKVNPDEAIKIGDSVIIKAEGPSRDYSLTISIAAPKSVKIEKVNRDYKER
jgi:sRNA-binding carbon storage regulator CsrA